MLKEDNVYSKNNIILDEKGLKTVKILPITGKHIWTYNDYAKIDCYPV